MAELFASMSVKWALDKLSSLLPASLQVATAPSTTSEGLEDLRMLERTMRRIHAMLHDAEEHWIIREESAKLRLTELKELAYDAEDVVDEYEYEANRVSTEVFERSLNTCNGKRKHRRLPTGGTPVNDEHYRIKPGVVPVPSELAVRARKVVQSPEKAAALHACCMSVFPIVGMGGVGKTTLAQLVYNDPRVNQSFDLCAWVCVSEYFDTKNITQKIISSLTKESSSLSELADLQEVLGNKLQGKSFLLVLDDVWTERRDTWELLCMPLFASSVCRIMVTTRNEAVAKLVQTMPFYYLDCLSSDDSWLLFQQAAFSVDQQDDTPADLDRLARILLGLPLAIKTLGSMLRYEADEVRWRYVLESDIWDLEPPQKEILPALELSYRHLPIHLKRCFVALSLFPKVDRSFLQVHDIQGLHIMHDLIHDLACFLAADEFFMLEADDGCIEIPPNVRAIIVLNRASGYIENPEELLLGCEKLRALVFYEDEFFLSKALEGFMGRAKLLRHLHCEYLLDNRYDISDYRLELHGIHSLINLHTLPQLYIGRNICNMGELKSLNKIKELTVRGLADLDRKEDAKEAWLHNKKHLQSLHLDFSRAIDLDDSPDYSENTRYESSKYPSWLGEPSFSNLTTIKFLFCKSERLPTLGELPSLQFLHVREMMFLQHIRQEFCSHGHGFKGFPALKKLKFVQMLEWSEWSGVDDGAFPRLHRLSIRCADNILSLPVAPFLSLVSFQVTDCPNITAIPASPSLRQLHICRCVNLDQLPSFPSLTTLRLGGPFKDNKPCRLLNNLSSLECLTITCNLMTCISLEPQGLPLLRKIKFSSDNLQYCHGLSGFTSLKELNITECPKLLQHSCIFWMM
uniref:NB-ARC domain-containing protein n=1 Tax=Oryza meridionalis TaxID=40149 RepID=A0A0E0F5X5_9ORYZ